MISVTVRSEEEFDKVVNEKEVEGLRLACMSNCGLPPGVVRLTFLPASSFANPKGKTAK